MPAYENQIAADVDDYLTGIETEQRRQEDITRFTEADLQRISYVDFDMALTPNLFVEDIYTKARDGKLKADCQEFHFYALAECFKRYELNKSAENAQDLAKVFENWIYFNHREQVEAGWDGMKQPASLVAQAD